ncbi:MAG TPA: antitoxin [Candidatus Paceibacterota bacterium]|nr:antitoxin [Verrucomicrobiota bacterium]HRY46716.1 antitoxin [Candidatus Paceibacterota bacterium]HSA00633.1 antitoxin [Candidatus Paceibacterota bacterium]
MRTTVTLDQDVERMLREAMHRSRTSFKKALNTAIRAGLSQTTTRVVSRPFVLKARPLGLRPGLDPAGFNKLADDLEVDAMLEKGQGGGAK